MNEGCTEMRRILREHFEKYDRVCFAVIEMPNPSEEDHAEFDRLTKDFLRFLEHVDSCPSCRQVWLAGEDQRGRLVRFEDVFHPANRTKNWETGLINRLPREEVDKVRRVGSETPCDMAQRYARHYGLEDRYVQTHLSWCERCRTVLTGLNGMTG